MAQKKDETKEPKAEAKPKRTRRPARTVEEQIADLRAKAAAQDARRKARLTRQLEEARAQQATARERLDKIDARVAELSEQLGEPAVEESGESESTES